MQEHKRFNYEPDDGNRDDLPRDDGGKLLFTRASLACLAETDHLATEIYEYTCSKYGKMSYALAWRLPREPTEPEIEIREEQVADGRFAFPHWRVYAWQNDTELLRLADCRTAEAAATIASALAAHTGKRVGGLLSARLDRIEGLLERLVS